MHLVALIKAILKQRRAQVVAVMWCAGGLVKKRECLVEIDFFGRK